MNSRKVFIFFSLACGLVALFLLGRVWVTNESLGDSLGEHNNTTTEQVGSTSAVAIVKARKAAFEELSDEAAEYGIPLMTWEVDDYRQFRNRIFINDNLASALRMAEKEGVVISLEYEFRISTKVVAINVDASDEEIIEFLLGE